VGQISLAPLLGCELQGRMVRAIRNHVPKALRANQGRVRGVTWMSSQPAAMKPSIGAPLQVRAGLGQRLQDAPSSNASAQPPEHTLPTVHPTRLASSRSGSLCFINLPFFSVSVAPKRIPTLLVRTFPVSTSALTFFAQPLEELRACASCNNLRPR
jgi:hypothetical protein